MLRNVHVSTFFQVEFWKEKATTKTKTRPKAAIFWTLFQKDFEKKKATTKTKILPKAAKSNFSTLFQVEFEQEKTQPKPRFDQKLPFFSTFSSRIWKEKTPTKTKIRRVEMRIFNFLAIRLDFQGKSNAKNRYAAVCHLFVLFTVARLILFLGKKATPKPRFDQKFRFFYFSTLLQIDFEKTTTTKTQNRPILKRKSNNQNQDSTKGCKI